MRALPERSNADARGDARVGIEQRSYLFSSLAAPPFRLMPASVMMGFERSPYTFAPWAYPLWWIARTAFARAGKSI